MKKRKLYHKLVRDRIPELLEESGTEFGLHQERGTRLRDYAMRKLQEEVMEFVENPCAEEAADIMEIMNFICHRLGIHEVAERAERYRALRNSTEFRDMKYAFDLWCSIWFWQAEQIDDCPLTWLQL